MPLSASEYARLALMTSQGSKESIVAAGYISYRDDTDGMPIRVTSQLSHPDLTMFGDFTQQMGMLMSDIGDSEHQAPKPLSEAIYYYSVSETSELRFSMYYRYDSEDNEDATDPT
jgi:hypothetical protein